MFDMNTAIKYAAPKNSVIDPRSSFKGITENKKWIARMWLVGKQEINSCPKSWFYNDYNESKS
jgi:hypothetical protein